MVLPQNNVTIKFTKFPRWYLVMALNECHHIFYNIFQVIWALLAQWKLRLNSVLFTGIF